MAFVGTAAWYFLIVNLAKVPFTAQLGLITMPSLRFDAMLLPVVIAGIVAGRLLLRRVPQRLFEWVTVALAIAAGLRLVTT